MLILKCSFVKSLLKKKQILKQFFKKKTKKQTNLETNQTNLQVGPKSSISSLPDVLEPKECDLVPKAIKQNNKSQ